MDRKFAIGDIVTTCNHGNGVVVSREHFDGKGNAVIESENPLSEQMGVIRFGVQLEFHPPEVPNPAYYWPDNLKHLT